MLIKQRQPFMQINTFSLEAVSGKAKGDKFRFRTVKGEHKFCQSNKNF